MLNGADVEEATAWKNGVFLFKSVDIETIMRQAARWYNVDVEYTKKCTGSFSGDIAAYCRYHRTSGRYGDNRQSEI